MTHCLLDTLMNAAAMRNEISALTDTTINDRRRCCLVDGGSIMVFGIIWCANDLIWWLLRARVDVDELLKISFLFSRHFYLTPRYELDNAMVDGQGR
jgi:hypothetical protein